MPEVDRRHFLAGVGATAGAGALRTLAVPARTQNAPGPFGWGVGSFDPTPTSVLLWTRVEPPADGATVEVAWALADDAAFDTVRAQGSVNATTVGDHTVRAQVDVLLPGRTYWYRFELADGTRSPVGRTRTMGGTERLRLGVVSCARFASGAYAGYRALAERDVDVVVHVGDYIYEDGQAGVRTHDPRRRCTTLADYRTRYAQHRADPDLQALHAAHPMVAVWDDHEVAGNAWRGGATSHDDDRDGPWLPRLVAAGRAHEEWVPGRTARGPDGRLRAWRSIDLGDLAELVVLDTRTWGRDRQPRTAAELDDSAAPRSMLGADQQAFVAERLEPSERRPWTFLANQVMFHPLRLPVPTQSLVDAVTDRGFIVDGASAINPDQWDGYPTAQAHLIRSIGGIGGVVALTGDVHSSWGWEGPANDGGNPTMVELVTPSITSETFADRIPAPSSVIELGLLATAPELKHVEISSHGYLLVDCTPELVQAEWWYVDPADVTTQRFGTARSAPRTPPMHLREVDEPTEDRTADARLSTGSDADDGLPVPALGLGAAAAAAVVGGLVAVRARHRR